MGKLIDLSGQRFGFWLVLKRGENNKKGQVQWLCTCECEKEKLVTSNSLRTGNSTSCGCNHTPDLTGQIFGKLKVIHLDSTLNNGRRHWICVCDCKKIIIVNTYNLRNNKVVSCGCIDKQQTTTKILCDENKVLIERGLKLIIDQNKIIELFKKELQKTTILLADIRENLSVKNLNFKN